MFASAQDVIVKKDGSTIVSKVIEITATEVKYKRFSNQDGPTYTIAKTEIQAINYENGEKDTFTTTDSTPSPLIQPQQQVSDLTLLQMSSSDPTMVGQIKANKLKKVGWIVGGALVVGGVVFACLTIPIDETDPDGSHLILDPEQGVGAGIPMILGGIATTVGCLIRSHNIEKRNRITVFNAPLYQKDFTFKNGSSLAAGVDILKGNHLNSQTLGLGLRFCF